MLAGRRILLVVSGSVAAYKALELTRLACEQNAADPQVRYSAKEILGAVARQLGNTPAVCKKAYVHPAVLALGTQLSKDAEDSWSQGNLANGLALLPAVEHPRSVVGDALDLRPVEDVLNRLVDDRLRDLGIDHQEAGPVELVDLVFGQGRGVAASVANRLTDDRQPAELAPNPAGE